MVGHAALALTFFLLSGCPLLVGTETIQVDRRSALAALAVELDSRYGYFITYEEGPFDALELREEKLANGKKYLSPVWKPIEFRLPKALANLTNSGKPGQISAQSIPPLDPGILDPLVAQYNESGNPGKFSVIYEGVYAHIVQDGRLVGGRTEQFEPILSTKVTFTPEARACSQALDDLFGQIGKLRHTSIVNVNIGIAGLWGRKCVIIGKDLTARDALEQILDQLGSSGTPAFPGDRFAWSLMYDASWREYFLNTRVVPDMTRRTTTAAPLEAPKTAAPTPLPSATSKASKVTPTRKD